jgi:4-amino-4-deoxy-L-arabinose transferase-like glycosyltransferase
MSQELLRLIMSSLATLLLAREATRARAGSRRQWAFRLGALGFGVLALGNLLSMLSLVVPALLTLLVGLGVVLLLASLACLLLAYTSGELNERLRRVSDEVVREREQLDRKDKP